MLLYDLLCPKCLKETESWERHADIKENKVLCECGHPLQIKLSATPVVFDGKWHGGAINRAEMVVENHDGSKKRYDISQKGVARPIGKH